MLDETSQTLLAALSALLPSSGFGVVERGDVDLPAEEFARALSLLETKGFVEVRYAEEDGCCLRLLPAARAYAEGERREDALRLRREKRLFLSAGLGAMLGGAAAGGIVALIALFV